MTTAPVITLRPVTTADLPLLRAIYGSTRDEELAPVPWTAREKEEFLDMQFHAQDTEYRRNYPGAAFQVIESDGLPAGRLYIHRRADEIRIMDIALLPDHRGQGIGTLLLGELIRESLTTIKPLTIHVEMHNPAQFLYQRLGFEPAGASGIHLLLKRNPSPPSDTP